MSNLDDISNLLTIDPDNVTFVQKLPWLFDEPESQKLHWSLNIQLYISKEENKLSKLQNRLNDTIVNQIKKNQIQQYIKNKHSNLKQMKKLLSDFLLEQDQPVIMDPSNFLSYQQNVFRDWVWGNDEIETYKNYILAHLGNSTKNILILGAGSCGLSYKIAKETNSKVISVDTNPFLASCAQRIFDQKHLKLFEFIEYPKNNSEHSYKREIKPVKEKLNNHIQIMSSFPQLPFKENCFDIVISCWFYDVIDYSLADSLKFTNFYLKPDGKNIFIGPSNFHKNSIEQNIDSNQIIKTFQENYEKTTYQFDQIPYLNNPNNSYKRLEEVLFLCSETKTSHQKYLKPETKELIQLTPKLEAYKQKTETFHRILKHLNTSKTYHELANDLEKEFNFNKQEALFYAQSFMAKLSKEIN